MDIISKHYGYVLVFNNKQDLESMIALMQGQLNHVEQNEVAAPHLMAVYTDKAVKSEYVEEELKNIKKSWIATLSSS